MTHGVMAEFDNAGDLLMAGKRAYDDGFRRLDAYSPVPIHGMAEAIGTADNKVSWIVLAGGIMGCLGGFAFAYFMSWYYPHNVGGRPLYSWPSFIPITFEITILLSAFSAIIGMQSNG